MGDSLTATEDQFHGYLTTEYTHVAEAHFRTTEAISSFFRYYLLIMSVPIALLSGFVGLSKTRTERLAVIADFGTVVGIVLLLVALAGLVVMAYIVNLRLDAVLYARTVNAIRKHFYDQADIKIDEKLRTRILPQAASQPAFLENVFFLPVIAAFALFDTFYMAAGLVLVTNTSIIKFSPRDVPWWIWPVVLLSPAAHQGVYWWLARYRERAYLRSYTVGIDIDGVLNLHRPQFCKLLLANTGVSLDPNDIVTIPLHDDDQQGVTRENELSVFNDPEYWTSMPALDAAASNFSRLRNGHRLKLRVFTYRPWPDLTKVADRRTEMTSWRSAAMKIFDETNPGWFAKVRCWIRLSLAAPEVRGMPIRRGGPVGIIRSWTSLRPIDVITRAWLKKNRFEFDGLTIERGNENVADPQGHSRNRFHVARRDKFRFFVEDDLEKASKLAFICDVVFLIDQTYNQQAGHPEITVPDNIIRCHSWDEVYKHIRRLT